MDPKANGSIGVQPILPRTGTFWQGQNPVPIQPNASDGADDAPSDPGRGATPDGVGKIVDKVV